MFWMSHTVSLRTFFLLIKLLNAGHFYAGVFLYCGSGTFTWVRDLSTSSRHTFTHRGYWEHSSQRRPSPPAACSALCINWEALQRGACLHTVWKPGKTITACEPWQHSPQEVPERPRRSIFHSKVKSAWGTQLGFSWVKEKDFRD